MCCWRKCSTQIWMSMRFFNLTTDLTKHRFNTKSSKHTAIFATLHMSTEMRTHICTQTHTHTQPVFHRKQERLTFDLYHSACLEKKYQAWNRSTLLSPRPRQQAQPPTPSDISNHPPTLLFLFTHPELPSFPPTSSAPHPPPPSSHIQTMSSYAMNISVLLHDHTRSCRLT